MSFRIDIRENELPVLVSRVQQLEVPTGNSRELTSVLVGVARGLMERDEVVIGPVEEEYR